MGFREPDQSYIPKTGSKPQSCGSDLGLNDPSTCLETQLLIFHRIMVKSDEQAMALLHGEAVKKAAAMWLQKTGE